MSDQKPDYVLMTLARLEKNIECQGLDIQKLKTWLIVLMVANVGLSVFSSVPVGAIVSLFR